MKINFFVVWIFLISYSAHLLAAEKTTVGTIQFPADSNQSKLYLVTPLENVRELKWIKSKPTWKEIAANAPTSEYRVQWKTKSLCFDTAYEHSMFISLMQRGVDFPIQNPEEKFINMNQGFYSEPIYQKSLLFNGRYESSSYNPCEAIFVDSRAIGALTSNGRNTYIKLWESPRETFEQIEDQDQSFLASLSVSPEPGLVLVLVGFHGSFFGWNGEPVCTNARNVESVVKELDAHPYSNATPQSLPNRPLADSILYKNSLVEVFEGLAGKWEHGYRSNTAECHAALVYSTQAVELLENTRDAYRSRTPQPAVAIIPRLYGRNSELELIPADNVSAEQNEITLSSTSTIFVYTHDIPLAMAIEEHDVEAKSKHASLRAEQQAIQTAEEKERKALAASATEQEAAQLLDAYLSCHAQLQSRSPIKICVTYTSLKIPVHSYVQKGPWFSFADQGIFAQAARYKQHPSQAKIVGRVYIPRNIGDHWSRFYFECDLPSPGKAVLDVVGDYESILVVTRPPICQDSF